MLTSNDLKQIEKHGISREQIDWQMSVFEKGPVYINLVREAIPGDGILVPNRTEIDKYVQLYDAQTKHSRIKFVPASGAATRMFKALYDFLDSYDKGNTELNPFLQTFFSKIKNFAFYDLLAATINKKGEDIHKLIEEGRYPNIIKVLLFKDGLNYGNLPKGLLFFHRDGSQARTPFEEHLVEAASYTFTNSIAKLHFTVSPEHKIGFEELKNHCLPEMKQRFGIDFNIEFSVQRSSTDTLAVDLHNKPFRDKEDNLVFRPGGHGALIDNLNLLEEDIIFIKNIDNVVPYHQIQPTIRYKKALAGILIDLRSKIFGILNELEDRILTPDRINEIVRFIKTNLQYEIHPDRKIDEELLKSVLNRPIRVCGVVKNLGEPGGGPFWAPNSSGDISLQIVESSQVNIANESQVSIFSRSTHFNPVDLVCSPVNYKGVKFDLRNFIDKNTCFISSKSKDGKELKALELPGLWNGAMADWLTIFVEVPIETFNPVKTVNDLLRPQHQ